MNRIKENFWRMTGLTSHTPTSVNNITQSMYHATREIHKQTERSEYINRLRKNILSEKGYVQHLSDLYSIYSTLESEMKKQYHYVGIQDVYIESLCRSPYIKKDIEAFNHPTYLPSISARSYIAHLRDLSVKNPRLLLAHAYVLYGGNLSGGAVIKNWVEKAFSGKTQFYNFDEFYAANMTKDLWKQKFDTILFSAQEQVHMHEEAALAFKFIGEMQNAALASSYPEKHENK